MSEINDIHKPFSRWLKERGIPCVYHRSDCRSGIRSGHPDFTLLHSGKCLMIEAKTEKGKLSVNQVLVIRELQEAGNRVEICRSYDECVKAAQNWLSGIPAAVTPAEPQTAPVAPPSAKEMPSASTRFVQAVANLAGTEMIVVYDREKGTTVFSGRALFPRDAGLPRLCDLVK